MKTKTLLLVTFLFLLSRQAFTQVQDLASLAQGKMVLGTTLFDADKKVYGYFYLYQQEVNKESYNVEYVLLDKNLNKVLNGNFRCSKVAERILESKFTIPKFMSAHLLGTDKIIIDKQLFYDFSGGYVKYSYIIISLKDNKASKEFRYDGVNFVDMPETPEELREYKKVKNKSLKPYSNGQYNGFLGYEEKNYEYMDKALRFYDNNKNLVWVYEYNPNGTNKDFYVIYKIGSGDNNLYFLEKHIHDNKIDCSILALDLVTGQKKYEYIFNTDQYRKYNHSFFTNSIEKKLIISGLYSEDNKNLGFYKIVLDETGKEIEKIHTKWSDYASFIGVDEKGRVEKDFRLTNPQFYFFKDGSISILTEKFKPEKKGLGLPIPIIGVITALATYSSQKTSDFVLFNMDKNFHTISVDTIKKDITKYNYTDLLYSQYIKDQTGVVFFYANETKVDKEKVYMLGINTIIDGKLTQEKIQLTAKKKYAIFPRIAKEGYILLNEINEEEKYNQIRLEKLNY